MPLRALKILVIVMGLMIVGGVGLLVATIAGRLSRHGSGAPAGHAAAMRPVVAPPVNLPPVDLPPVNLPTGARIEAIGTGSGRIVLALALPDGSRELVILDLATGRRVGTIPLHSSP